MRLVSNPLSPADLSDIAGLYNEAMQKIWSQESIAETFYIQGTFALLNKENSGFCIFREIIDEAEIFYIGVLKPDRQKGLGSALLEESLRIIKEKGILKVFLEVSEENIPAIEFYKKHGFTEIGRRLNYYKENGRSVPAINMKLEL